MVPATAVRNDLEPQAYLGLVINGSDGMVEPTATSQATLIPTATPQATLVPATSTNTPIPPTATPIPPPTATPAPTSNPFVFSGSGSKVIGISWVGRGIVKLSHRGSRNFIVWAYDSVGKRIDLIANEIGNFDGVSALNFRKYYADATRFEVTADGAWQIEILPVGAAPHLNVAGGIDGIGDAILVLTGSVPSFIRASSTSSRHNFIIWAYPEDKNDSPDLLFNEISPYSGEAVMDNNAKFLVITATGSWHIDVR